MILAHRDATLIPAKLLEMAEKAQKKLETLDTAERPDFIRKKARIWRLFEVR